MLHHNRGLADWVLSKEEMNKTIKSLNDECLKYIDQIDVENLISVPKDLDLQPYRDEKDLKILRAIREAQK